MNVVLAVLEHGAADQPVADVATAIAAIMNASVRRIDLTGLTGPAHKADRVLTELAEAATVLGVLPGAAPLRRLSWAVLQRARKPVVLVPAAARPAPQMISRALIPLDGTPESAAAVAETIRLLARAGVDIVVLHVFDATTVPKFWDQPAHAEQTWQGEFLARYCDQPGVRLQVRVGVPGEHVLDVAATEQANLIALGWSRRPGRARARTLRQTLREARVPVLVVPIVTPLWGTLAPYRCEPGKVCLICDQLHGSPRPRIGPVGTAPLPRLRRRGPGDGSSGRSAQFSLRVLRAVLAHRARLGIPGWTAGAWRARDAVRGGASMRIGLIAPPWAPVPPAGYGGTEVVVDNLARGLAELGHDVVLFTVGESTCPVSRDWLYQAAVDPMGTSVEEAAHVLAAYEALADVELIHDHTVLGPLLAGQAGPGRHPVVTTHHGAFTVENLRIFAEIAKRAAIVAISRDQASRAADIPIAAVIHHGIDLDLYQPGTGDGGYLMFMGRMSPEKGVSRAVRIAHASGRPLRLVTKIREAVEQDYFTREVQPLLGPDDHLVIEPSLASRLEMLRGAAALINPITWPEPFGLAMAEALATGTPVLAFPSGAAPEIISDGKTGYLCQDEADMVTAIGRIGHIDRAECRAAAEQHFSLQRMTLDYARLYRRVLANPPGTGARRTADSPRIRNGNAGAAPAARVAG